MKYHQIHIYAAICGIFFFSTLHAQPMIDIQGHRGCRGLLPENTIPAFIEAVDLGVTTLEMDAVISKDGQVVVSHEPFLSHVICTGPEGETITEDREKSYNLYEMTYAEISQCDCGSLKHPSFPKQQKMQVRKPLLRDVIKEVEDYVETNALPSIQYNIETKSAPEGDNIFHPKPSEFVDLLVEVIKKAGISERTTIQSFDVRTLQYAHRQYPELKLALLVGNKEDPQQNLQTLGFTPQIYSPYYRLVNTKTVSYTKEQGMKIIPWTVNETKDIQEMINLKVDGIISDYPDRVLQLVKP